MFEFHGRFNILEAPHFVEEGRIGKIRLELENYVSAMEGGKGENNLYVELRHMNGEVILYVGGIKNHRGVAGEELDCLLDWTAK